MKHFKTAAIGLLSATLLASPALAPASAQLPGKQGGEIDFNDLAQMAVLGPSDPTLRKAQAIVNGDVITDTDIDQRLALVLAANGGNVDEAERPRLRLQVLRNLIDEKLQIQEAESNSIRIPDAEVEAAYARVAQNFRRTPTEFADYLKGAGSSPMSIKAQIRGELAWSRVLRRMVEPMVNVGDDEVQQLIDKLNAAKGKD